MKRDFTDIDDVVPAVLSVLDAPLAGDGPPHHLYNVGNDRPEALTDFVAELERALGRKAVIEHAPMQPGDVEETWADISALQREHGYAPKTTIAEGIPASSPGTASTTGSERTRPAQPLPEAFSQPSTASARARSPYSCALGALALPLSPRA